MSFPSTSSRASAVVVIVVACLVCGVASRDFGPPLLGFHFDIGNILAEIRSTLIVVPHALMRFVGTLVQALLHPVEAAKVVFDNLRPDHLLKELTHKPINCSCVEKDHCLCCLHIFIPFFEHTENLCYNLSVNLSNLSVTIMSVINNRRVIQTVLSGSHPPPICITPPTFPVAFVCARLHDLGIKNGSLQLCLNNEVSLLFIRLFVLRYDCIHIGLKGIHLLNSSLSEDSEGTLQIASSTPQPLPSLSTVPP